MKIYVQRRPASRAGFTLAEVVMAVMVLIVGVVAIMGLLSAGLDTQKQSADDIRIAAFTEEVFGNLRVMALNPDGSTFPWSAFTGSSLNLAGRLHLPDPNNAVVQVNGAGIITYRYTGTATIDEAILRYQLVVVQAAGNPRILTATLRVSSGPAGIGYANVFYTELFNYGM